MQPDHQIVAVKFGNSDRSYDYLADGFEVSVGQKVIIPMRGREVSVEVVEIKAESELAKVAILRLAEPENAPVIDVRTDEQRAEKYANGAPVWAPDGTMLDEDGALFTAFRSPTQGEPA